MYLHALNIYRTNNLQCRSILLTTKKYTSINSSNTSWLKHIYTFDASIDLPFSLIPLTVDYKINHKYPKALGIPMLNSAYDRDCIPRVTMFGMLYLIEIKSTGVSNISWTKTGNHKMTSEIVQKNCQPYHQSQASHQDTIIWKCSQWYYWMYRFHKEKMSLIALYPYLLQM